MQLAPFFTFWIQKHFIKQKYKTCVGVAASISSGSDSPSTLSGSVRTSSCVLLSYTVIIHEKFVKL